MGEPNCPAISVLGARKGLQARAQLTNQGSGGRGPGRNSGYRANSLQLLSQHRIPCYTWGGPARSLSIPSSYFASFFSRPSTPYSCPTSYLPKAMNPNNTMLLLRGVTCHPSPLLPRSLAPWSEESAGKSGAPCADRHRGPTRAESNLSTGCGPNACPPFPGTPPSSRQPAKALEAELPRRVRRDGVMQGWLGKARGQGGRRTHPRPDVVHRLRAAAPAAQTPHPQHFPAPGWSTSLMVLALSRVARLSRERARSGVSGRAARRLLYGRPAPAAPRAPIGCREQVAGSWGRLGLGKVRDCPRRRVKCPGLPTLFFLVS